MTQVVVMLRQTPDQSPILIQSEVKNHPLTSSSRSLKDIVGLSWLIPDDHETYGLDTK